MAFSRNFYDTDNCNFRNFQSTIAGRYALEVPGNGSMPPFVEDPHIILQKWGANLRTHPVNLESYLLGYDDKLARDCITEQPKMPSTSLPQYPVNDKTFTDDPRLLYPAWELKGMKNQFNNVLIYNPQAYTEIPFRNNISTRTYERHQKRRSYC